MPGLYEGLTVIEILALAIKKELDAASFYKQLAGKIANPIIRERFLQLAKEERMHRALLQAEYKRLTGESKKPPLPKGKFTTRDDFVLVEASIEQALLYAIQTERDAQKLYATAAKTSSDPRGKRLLEYLVEFEKGHERQLKSELNFYRKAPLWFDETQEEIHVGP